MNRTCLFLISLVIIAGTLSCASFKPSIHREVLRDKVIAPGSYRLILYGARHGEDLETLALLDYEGDAVTFEPYAPAYDYTTKNRREADDAFAEASVFVSWYPSFLTTRLSRITDMQGRLLGYELRPIYMRTTTYGYSDVLNVYYDLKDRVLFVHVSLKRAVERALEGNGHERDE